MRNVIEELRSDRRGVILCTHNLPEAERLCDRILVLNTRSVAEGTPETLKRHMFGTRTLVGLANAQSELATRLLSLPFVKHAEVSEDELSVEMTEPETHNPELVRHLVYMGAEILHVMPHERSLEDVHLRLMEDKDAA